MERFVNESMVFIWVQIGGGSFGSFRESVHLTRFNDKNRFLNLVPLLAFVIQPNSIIVQPAIGTKVI